MTPERRARLAKGLATNELLPVLFDERSDEIRETWETTEPGDAETRERLYVELRTLSDLRDFVYARLAEYAGDGEQK